MVWYQNNNNMKLRTTIYLRGDLKRLVEEEGINLSAWVNEMLETYLLSGSIEKIKREIEELEARKQILMKRLEKLEEKGILKSREDVMKEKALQELQEKYIMRREQKLPEELDYAWITSPKNLQRVRILGKTPEEVLDELKEWYNSTKSK